MRQLRAYGVTAPETVLRRGTAAMVERVLAWARDTGASPSLVVRVLMDGGVIFSQRNGTRRESASAMLRDIQEAQL